SSLRRSTVKIDRRFTRRGQNPYEGITFVKRSSEIRNPDGSSVFKLENIDAPEAWSQLAVDILAKNIFGRPEFRSGIKMGSRSSTSMASRCWAASETPVKSSSAWPGVGLIG